jgi:hypothetical protein
VEAAKLAGVDAGNLIAAGVVAMVTNILGS